MVVVAQPTVNEATVDRLAGIWERTGLTPMRGEGFRRDHRACLLAAMQAEAERLDPDYEPLWDEGLAEILDLPSDDWVKGLERGYEGAGRSLPFRSPAWRNGYQHGAAVAARVFGGV